MTDPEKDLALGIIGCGSLGGAILDRLLTNKKQHPFAKFYINANSASSVKRLDSSYEGDERVSVRRGDNAGVASFSDVMILACPPGDMVSVVDDEPFRQAVTGKTLISLAAGITLSRISEALGGECRIARAMPNMAAAIGASTTGLQFLNNDHSNFSSEDVGLVESIFNAVGSTTHLTANEHMDACTVLSGSTPAFFALLCDAMVDGAVASGVPRDKARFLVSGALGSAAAVLNGEDGSGKNGMSPSELRETICAMPGCTITGVVSLEHGNVRGVVAKAVIESIAKAKSLG